MQLPLAAVDEQDVGHDLGFVEPLIATQHDLVDAGNVVDPLDAADAHSPETRLERQPVDELHNAGDGVGAAGMGDVNAFDRPRLLLHPQDFLQAGEALFWIDGKNLRLDVGFQAAALVERFQQVDFVPQPGGLLELQFRGRGGHVFAHLAQEGLSFPFEKRLQAVDVLAVFLPRNPQVARRRTLAGGSQQARAKPSPARIAFVDVQGAGAKLEDLLQNRHRPAQRPRIGERSVKFRAALLRRARDADAGIVFVGADFQVGKRLVVAEVAIEFRQEVLDEPGLHEQGVDFAFRCEEVDVADFRHEARGPRVFGGRFEEVAPRPRPQVLRLADVDHSPGGVLHQVHARQVWKRADLFGRGRVVLRRLGGFGQFTHIP